MDSMVKAELRARIQLQRLLSGQEELTVEFPASPVYELTPEEVVKIERRRSNNRISATKSRQKKRQLEKTLEQKYNQLCVQNAALENESKILRMQIKTLKHKLNTHKCHLQPIAGAIFTNGSHSQPITCDDCDNGGNLHIPSDTGAKHQEELISISQKNVGKQETIFSNYSKVWHLPEDTTETRNQRENDDQLKHRLEWKSPKTAISNTVSMDHSYVTTDDILKDITSFDLCEVFDSDLDDCVLME